MSHSTPDRQSRPNDVEQSPLDILIHALQDTPSVATNGSFTPVHQISPEQLEILLQHFRQQQDTIDKLLGQQSRQSNYAKPPDYYNIAKYEDIIWKGIKPAYDRSPDNLVPFLNCIDIW